LDEEKHWKMLLGNPTRHFLLSANDVAGVHAGIGMFTMFLTKRQPIPKEWQSYGRTILFKELSIVSKTGQRYIAAMTYIRGLVYDSRLPDNTEWVFHKVALDEDGKPSTDFMAGGKKVEDMSSFYRYLVFQ
jgi:hypothetical protein